MPASHDLLPLLVTILQHLDIDRFGGLVVLSDVHHLRELETELVPETDVSELLLCHAGLFHVVEMHEKVLPVVVHHNESVILVLIKELEPPRVSLGRFFDDHRLFLRLVLLSTGF